MRSCWVSHAIKADQKRKLKLKVSNASFENIRPEEGGRYRRLNPLVDIAVCSVGERRSSSDAQREQR